MLLDYRMRFITAVMDSCSNGSVQEPYAVVTAPRASCSARTARASDGPRRLVGANIASIIVIGLCMYGDGRARGGVEAWELCALWHYSSYLQLYIIIYLYGTPVPGPAAVRGFHGVVGLPAA